MDVPRWWVATLVDACEVGDAGQRVCFRRMDFNSDWFYVLASYQNEQTVFVVYLATAKKLLKTWRRQGTSARIPARDGAKLEWIREGNQETNFDAV